MTTIAIHRLKARLRVADDDGRAAARLKRLLADMLDGALELALQQRGLDGRGELCIRHLYVPVRLDLAAADPALVAQWALQVSAVVAGMRGDADAGLVHYGSRAHALADLVLAAPAGDFTRAWAWRSLGLWPAGEAVGAADMAGLVLRALAANAGQAVAVLARLAQHPVRFEHWWQRVPAPALEALACAVLRDAGADVTLAYPAPGAPAGGAFALPPWLRGAALAQMAERRALPAPGPHEFGPAPPAGWTASRALAVLAVAEAEPTRLQTHGAALAVLLDGLAARWAPAHAQAQPPGAGAATARHAAGLAPPPPAQARPQGPAGAQGTAGRFASGNARAPEPAVAHALHLPRPRAAREARALVRQQPADIVRVPAEAGTALPVRTSADTAFGGLPFLLNLAADLGWPGRWLADPALAARGMRWGLYQLALRLLPAEGRRDPAALAFAGLLPGAALPDAGGPAPDDAESAALAALHGELLAALRARLPQANDDDAALLSWVCRRAGQIRADPGWLELHLSLDAVRTDIRAAGLDMDPGWIAWLGLVIRFVYG